MDRFKHDLGAELVAAGRRRVEPSGQIPSPRRLLSPVVALIAAGIVAVVGVLGYSVLRAATADAKVFAVTRLDGRVELEVVDIVTDPNKVIDQLATELGLDAELFAVPVSGDLIGQLITAGSLGDVVPGIVRDTNGVISRIVLPEGFNGKLIIEFGRHIKPGEIYVSSRPDPVCGELWGQTPAESMSRLQQLASDIRYETEDEQQASTTNVKLDDINPNYQLVDVTYLDPNTIVVTYAADPTLHPRLPNCQ